MLRLFGLAGLAACLVVRAVGQKWQCKPLISWLGLTATGVFLLLYLFGVLIDADPAGHRLLPAGRGW